MEPHPSRMLGGAARLRRAGAAAARGRRAARLAAQRSTCRGTPTCARDAGRSRLDHAADRGFSLPVRYAVLVHRIRGPRAAIRPRDPSRPAMRVVDGVRIAERISRRLKVPAECRDAARLAARWGTRRRPSRASSLRRSSSTSSRRPMRCAVRSGSRRCSTPANAMALRRVGASGEFAPARIVRAALDVVRGVDAGAVARRTRTQTRMGATGRADAVGKAVRAARLRALRDWRRAGGATP